MPTPPRRWSPRALLVCALALALPAAARAQVGAATSLAASVEHVHAAAHAIPSPAVEAVSVDAGARHRAIALDGALDPAEWDGVPAATDFVQFSPDEGKPATQRTEVRIVYDAGAIYIGARMYDTEGARGVRTQLTRRDQQNDGDYLEFVLDTYHDHLGRTIFQVDPSGVKFDAGQSAPNADPAWDPVWQVATRVDSLGWTAEIRIPLSQLRFPHDSVQTWGMQIWRYEQRVNETSMWSFWKRNELGGPQRFGHLEGLRLAAAGSRHVELMPYAVTRAAYVQPAEPSNPFLHARETDYRFGGDVKALLGSSFTLDATFNPDFGQVEVDPAVVNLTAFETFYEEKRPFFVAGSGNFGFGSFSCFFCSNVSSMSLFYSRRIGRAPQGEADGTWARSPENTTILGAAKLTGRTRDGWSVGFMDAVTRAARADVLDTVGTARRFTQEVEPFTNYAVARVKRDLLGGRLSVGGIVTSVDRRLDDASLRDLLAAHAQSAGADFRYTWHQQTYSVMGNLAASRVAGDSLAMLRVQLAPARYFQRPDKVPNGGGLFSDGLDSSATSLAGYGGYLRLAKDAGDWLWEAQTNFRSPGFEVNDLAFLTRADYVWLQGNVGRQWTKPTRWFRDLWVVGGVQRQSNFDGDVNDGQVHGSISSTLPNYWSAGIFVIDRPAAFDERLTRGGPTVRRPGDTFARASLTTDQRRRIVLSTAPSYQWRGDGTYGYNVGLDVTVKPADNVQLTLAPNFDRSGTGLQFVTSDADPTASAMYGARYVFADLVQRTVSMETRLNVTFTPELSLQLYAQPYIASGAYSRFKEFARARTGERHVYAVGPTVRDSLPGTPPPGELIPIADSTGHVFEYSLQPAGSASRFAFDNPDFNFRSLRGNAILRWEYRPGSTLYFVWTQQRQDYVGLGDFDFRRDRAALFRAHPDNVFLVKLSYWFGV